MSKCHITSENIKTHIFFFFWTSVLIYQMLSWDLCCYVLHKFVYNNKKLFEWLNFEIYLIAELVCLFAENYNNLLSKVICFSFLWSVVAHLPCDLLRQSGHFWRKKREKVGTSDLLQLLSYLRLSFFIFFLPPPTLLLFLRVCFMDEYCLAKNLSAPAPQDVSTHRTWQWIVYSQPGLATEKGDTGPLHIFPPQGIFSSSSENEW